MSPEVGDIWILNEEEKKLVRKHNVPRQAGFVPLKTTEPPVDVSNLTPERRTNLVFLDGQSQTIEDLWTEDRGVSDPNQPPWTGETIFTLKEDSSLPPTEAKPGRQRKKAGGDEKVLKRKRARTRQLQRGLWTPEEDEELKVLVQRTLEEYREQGAQGWIQFPIDGEVGGMWKNLESARADVQLVAVSSSARRMRKPQPFRGPNEVPLRKGILLMTSSDVLTTGWEDWQKSSPASQIRPLPSQTNQLFVTLFGAELGDGAEDVEMPEDGGDRPIDKKERDRERQWQALPRELKLAIQRIHCNLGHARLPDMLRALRVSRASEVAIKACRLFRCKECPRLLEPKIPRPSKLPIVDEFGVMVGMDVFEDKDSNGEVWSWLNIVDQGTGFQVCCLLQSKMPTSQEILECFETSWANWAGMPEYGVIVDRAKNFLGRLSSHLSNEGCVFDTAAKASPWQIGQIERAGGLWKAMFRRMVWSEQLAGREDVLLATGAINTARNALTRKSGFSPQQWVLGRSLRLPADLCDEGEVARVGALAASSTPGTRFYRKQQLRMSAREAFMKVQNSEVLRRAELRRIRPTRGPFHVGDFVFYYDQSTSDYPSPNCWRGVARVVGHEGSRTVWLSHRGILVAVSPEHLSHANEEELRGWLTVSNETVLQDATPAAGGAGFLDLRRRPAPPEDGFPEGEEGHREEVENRRPEGESSGYEPSVAPAGEAVEEPADLSASSTSMPRMELESERERERQSRSFDFFDKKSKERRIARAEASRKRSEAEARQPVRVVEGLEMPVGPEFDPDLDDYHQAVPTAGPPPLPTIGDDTGAEAAERSAKRLRTIQEEAPGSSSLTTGGSMSYHMVVTEEFASSVAEQRFHEKEDFYAAASIDLEAFLFGVERNDFRGQYEMLLEEEVQHAYSTFVVAEAEVVKKKARKEVKLTELDIGTREMFTKPGGSDEVEWNAWLDKEACEVLSLAESRKVMQTKKDCIIPTRWVRTNKNDGKPDEPYKAKSRLVVQGFKDKALGEYRRDAPTASSLAESVCLMTSAVKGFTLVSKDVKNAYFSGKSIDRELYLQQPRGGLPGLQGSQLLRAKKAIYGFAEAARLFWLALKEHLEKDGWTESRLEPALFYLRKKEKLCGILVTHVDDLEAGVHPEMMTEAFAHSSMALEFATNHEKSFTFRGREIHQGENGHIDVTMSNYVRSMKPVKIDKERKRNLEARLSAGEKEILQSSAGELGWVTRQLRSDLAYENGCIQRCKKDPCIADLLRLRQAVAAARRASDFRLRYWADIRLEDAVVVHLADSGHANGNPDHDGIAKYRSVGGYYLFVAEKGILEGEEVRANLLSYHSTQTKRVCRSTLAAEAAHLAEAVEAGDWLIVLLAEVEHGRIDLKHWESLVEDRERVYVTDAQSVYDYLKKDSNSTSSDKRMAIEGALLRETVRRRGAHVRWIDGEQNMADILTKAGADKTVLFDYLKTGRLSLVQNQRNKETKEKKRMQRQNRRKVVKDTGHREKMLDERIKRLAEEMRAKKEASSEEEAERVQVNKEK